MADTLVKHAFVSSVTEGTDPTKVRTSNWNAPLLFSAGSTGQILLRDTGSATGASWSVPTMTAAGATLAPDGTALLPAYSFTAEPTLGFWRNGATLVAMNGRFSVNPNSSPNGVGIGNTGTAGGVAVAAAGLYAWGNATEINTLDVRLGRSGLGQLNVTTNGTIGSVLNVSALPTIASGFGTGAAITAGSTPLAGSVNVGTGGIATNGVINFNGTAFPSAPFVVATNSVSHASPSQAVASTTQLTLFTVTAWPANSIVSWIAVSSK